MAKRHLRDLYVRGVLHNVGEDTGDPVQVYIKKLNKVENEEAIRRANAARARILAQARDKESDLYMEAAAEAHNSTRDSLTEYLIAEKLSKAIESIDAQLAAEDEWAEEGYLLGLQESWTSGLQDRYAENPEDPEAKKVFEEMKRYTDKFTQLVEREQEALKKEWEHYSDEEIVEKALEVQLKLAGDLAWVDEYRKCEIYLSVKDPEDHRQNYFENREEVDELEVQTLLDLLRTYRNLSVDVQEGKDSEETPSS